MYRLTRAKPETTADKEAEAASESEVVQVACPQCREGKMLRAGVVPSVSPPSWRIVYAEAEEELPRWDSAMDLSYCRFYLPASNVRAASVWLRATCASPDPSPGSEDPEDRESSVKHTQRADLEARAARQRLAVRIHREGLHFVLGHVGL